MTKFRIPEIAFGALLVIAVISVVWILRPQLLCSCNQVEQGWWEKFQNESRPRESEQGDKWSFCLTAGTLCPANQERQ